MAQRAEWSPAPTRPIHASASCMPTSAAHPSVTQAISVHAQSSAAHSTTCAHTAQSRTLRTRTCCSRTRTDPMNPPASRHLKTHTVAPLHALPTLPLLDTH